MIVLFLQMIPPCPSQSSGSKTDEQIRLTPSHLGDGAAVRQGDSVLLSSDSVPPLYHLWNVEKNRQNRANQNLSYRSDEYTPRLHLLSSPNALSYDLESYNFLRIEGHLGKDYIEAF